MTEQDSITEKILIELSKDILDANQVSGILNSTVEFPKELIDKLSLATALKYWEGQIDFRSGDCILNNLFSFWIHNESYFSHCKFPDIAWECYTAFDAGEFYRENDDRTSDPSEKYTRPPCRKLIKRTKANNIKLHKCFLVVCNANPWLLVMGRFYRCPSDAKNEQVRLLNPRKRNLTYNHLFECGKRFYDLVTSLYLEFYREHLTFPSTQ